jgi:YfiR/HmsC-like
MHSRFTLFLAALVFTVFWHAPVLSAAPRLQDVDRKILYGEVIPRYLVTFGNVIGWPDAASTPAKPFRIGLLGADPTGGALEKLVTGNTLKGRPLAIVRADDPAGLAECQIIFADQPTQDMVDKLATVFAGKPVLTVVFSADRTARGGMIELFITRDDAVGYTLNVKALRQASLAPSPELLQLALRAPPR